MFIDEARQLVQAHSSLMDQLLEVWETARLGFLTGKGTAESMRLARRALRMGWSDPDLFKQVEEAVLSGLDDRGLDQQLQAMYHRMAASQGSEALRDRREDLLTSLEARRLEHRPGFGGRSINREQIRRVLADSRLMEERAVAWETLMAPARAVAAETLELRVVELEITRAAGYANALDAQAQELRLDADTPEHWRDLLQMALGDKIKAAAASWLDRVAAGLRLPHQALEAQRLGGLYLSDTEGWSGLGADAVTFRLGAREPLELLVESADLLGLELADLLQRWIPAPAAVPDDLLGRVLGRDGRWPVVLHRFEPGCRGMLESLETLGSVLAEQSWALAARAAGEEASPPFPLRSILARGMAASLGRLAGHPAWNSRLLGVADERIGLFWSEWRLLRLGEHLLRLEWLHQAPGLTLRQAGELWLELREERLGLPSHEADRDLWAADPQLSLRADEPLVWLCGELMAASGELRRGGEVALEPGPELGGQLLDMFTEPGAPEIWEDALDEIRVDLNPRSLITSLGSGTREGNGVSVTG